MMKLNVRCVPGFYVWAYKPYQTKKGHKVWRASHIVAGPFTSPALAQEAYPEATRQILHNAPLTDDEEVKALAVEREKP